MVTAHHHLQVSRGRQVFLIENQQHCVLQQNIHYHVVCLFVCFLKEITKMKHLHMTKTNMFEYFKEHT